MPLNIARQQKVLLHSLKESMDKFNYSDSLELEQDIQDGNLHPIAEYMGTSVSQVELFAINQHGDQLQHFYHLSGITAFSMIKGVEKTSIQPI